MGEAISLRVPNRSASADQVVKQIETPRSPAPIMRRPRADREEKRVTRGSDTPGQGTSSRRSLPHEPQSERTLSDAEWAVLAPLLPAPSSTGRPWRQPLRAVFDGILYVSRTGCACDICRWTSRHGPRCTLAHNDLRGGLAPVRDERTHSAQRADDAGVVPRLRGAGDRSKYQTRRHSHPRQSARPQGRSDRGCHRGQRRTASLPAAVLARTKGRRGDFNSIEMAFAKLKALLRKAAERTVDRLWTVVGYLLDAFTPAECENYFAAAGHDPE